MWHNRQIAKSPDRQILMNRLAFKLLVLLLGGAIINIAIAWGCAMLCGPVDLTTELGAYGETFKDGPALLDQAWQRTLVRLCGR